MVSSTILLTSFSTVGPLTSGTFDAVPSGTVPLFTCFEEQITRSPSAIRCNRNSWENLLFQGILWPKVARSVKFFSKYAFCLSIPVQFFRRYLLGQGLFIASDVFSWRMTSKRYPLNHLQKLKKDFDVSCTLWGDRFKLSRFIADFTFLWRNPYLYKLIMTGILALSFI